MKVLLDIKESAKIHHFLDFIKDIDFIRIDQMYSDEGVEKSDKALSFNELERYNRSKNINISPEIDINQIIDECNL